MDLAESCAEFFVGRGFQAAFQGAENIVLAAAFDCEQEELRWRQRRRPCRTAFRSSELPQGHSSRILASVRIFQRRAVQVLPDGHPPLGVRHEVGKS